MKTLTKATLIKAMQAARSNAVHSYVTAEELNMADPENVLGDEGSLAKASTMEEIQSSLSTLTNYTDAVQVKCHLAAVWKMLQLAPAYSERDTEYVIRYTLRDTLGLDEAGMSDVLTLLKQVMSRTRNTMVTPDLSEFGREVLIASEEGDTCIGEYLRLLQGKADNEDMVVLKSALTHSLKVKYAFTCISLGQDDPFDVVTDKMVSDYLA